MLDQNKHKVQMLAILRDIAADPQLRTILGFKGGTAAMLFYDLPRFSVDLDFDLLNPEKKTMVLERMRELLRSHGTILDAAEKYFTLFFLISYEKNQRGIKIEISKRKSGAAYEVKSYLGLPMLVMKQPDITACKISALLTRQKFAMRDVYDVWFFLKNSWPINEKVLEEKAGLPLKKALAEAVKKVSALKSVEILQGLGELLTESQKSWVKEKLIDETVFYLRVYQKLSENNPVTPLSMTSR